MRAIARISHRFDGQGGVQRSLIPWGGAVSTGLALALAFPWPDLHLLVWIALVPLLVVLRGQTAWRALWLGLVAGLVFRVGSLYWIAHTVGNYGGVSIMIGALVALALALWMAFNVALFALLVPSALRWGPGGAVALATAWVALEYLQTLLPFGFPWALVGYAAGRWMPLMQAADLAGIWGLSFVAVFVNVALALLIIRERQAFTVVAVGSALVVAMGIYGGFHLYRAPALLDPTGLPQASAGTTLRVAVVQGNVPQGVKWDPESLVSTLNEHARLTYEAATDGAELIVWPESSVPVPGGLEGDLSTRTMLSAMARENRVPMVVGSLHVEAGPGGRTATNAAFMIDAEGAWLGRYDKVRLVPFGEYVPLSWFFRFVAPLVEVVGEFKRGERGQPLLGDTASGVPSFGMAICYEIVFPDHVRQQVARGATFLVTITNDAWFGNTSAPYQHFAMARLRAVETRRYLVRAANTGISGVVDPWGRVLEVTDLDETVVARAQIEPRDGRSPYVVWGDLFARVCVLLSLVAAGMAVRDGRRRPYSMDR